EFSTFLNSISSSHIKETSKDLSHNILYNTDDLHTCFNRFLLHYQLPLLAYGQTIQTLIQHIDKYNNNKTVSSITFSVNLSHNETLIYLPNDTLT
ncbi:11124_t:CDS:1, partial [Racocetra persica]